MTPSFSGITAVAIAVIACAVALGIMIAYHFWRYSPDRGATTWTIGVYAFGVLLIALYIYASIIRL